METAEDYWTQFWRGMMAEYGYAVTGDSDDPTLWICERAWNRQGAPGDHLFDGRIDYAAMLAGVRERGF